MSDIQFVETEHGTIHKADIPLVVNEPFKSKITKAILFYGVFIVLCILVCACCAWRTRMRAKHAAQQWAMRTDDMEKLNASN